MNNKSSKKECLIYGSPTKYDWASSSHLEKATTEAALQGCKNYIGSSHTYYINSRQINSPKAIHFFKK